MKETSRGAAWTALAALTTLAVFFAVFMEWLFFATQQSFLSALGFGEQLRALGAAALPPLAAGLAVVTIAAALSLYSRRAAGILGRSVPALVLTASFLLLADNFTHTVFHFGIFSLRGYARFLYTPVLAALALAAWRLVRGGEAALLRRRGLRAAAAAAGVARSPWPPPAAAGTAGGAAREHAHDRAGQPAEHPHPRQRRRGRPRHLSLYGYRREDHPLPRPARPASRWSSTNALLERRQHRWLDHLDPHRSAAHRRRAFILPALRPPRRGRLPAPAR